MLKNRQLLLRICSLGDQVAFSAANFFLTMTLAKHYPDFVMAGYAIGLSVAVILQAVQRTTYMVHNAVLPPAILRRRAARVLGQHGILWGGLCVAELTLFGIVGALVQCSDYFQAIAACTLVCTLLYIPLDFDRMVLIKHGRSMDSMITSLIFLLLSAALFFSVPHTHMDYGVVLALVALFALGKSLWLFRIVGRPDFFWGWRLFRRDMRKYLTTSVLGVAGYAGYSTVPIFTLGAVAPHIHAAAYGAMRSLIQPAMVLIRSMDVVDKNVLQTTVGDTAGLRRIVFRQLLAYSLCALTAIGAIELCREFLVRLVYGEKYVIFSDLLLGWGIILVCFAVSGPLETVIVKQGKLNHYNLCRLPAGLTGIILSVLLCEKLGAWGAMIGCLGGWMVSVGSALWLIRDVLFFKPAARPPFG